MSVATVVMRNITCHQTTESGHDEVYYLPPSVVRRTTHGVTSDPTLPAGPTASQGANAGGPDGRIAAWDCNDSGYLSNQEPQAELFSVSVGAGEHVVVTLTLMESDGTNYADMELTAAKAGAAALAAVTTAFPPSAVVTAPLALALTAGTAVMQALKGLFSNDDDTLGAMTFVLEGAADGVRLVQQGAVSGTVIHAAANGSPAAFTARLGGAGANYEFTLGIDGAVMAAPVPNGAPADPGPVVKLPRRPTKPGGWLPRTGASRF
ncbi:hypothetical protein GCM10009841_34190 [Microlunatus panaciterrae]|uniref:Uncharacterized protein n=1 Tax=Microlunatus panaciterrae TaxID=400768 RepID=A0ABS2RHC8_9ACTN|nr:hypothetical protein [Microlunatus panaciterrae]MBM7798078.1 hypothetical protein [Microlunatus panaciterrae]